MPPACTPKIRSSLPLVAGLLLGGTVPWAQTAAPATKLAATAALYLTVEDTAAEVQLDGKPLLPAPGSPNSPGSFSLEGLKPGKHRIVARSPHRLGKLELDLRAGEVRHARLRMRPSVTPVRLISWPQEAQVFLAETRRGRTPLNDTLPEGRHRLTFKLADHLDTTLVLDTDSTRRLEIRMVPAGTLAIEPESGIELFLGRGTQNLTHRADGPIRLAAGNWQVRTIHPDWVPLDTLVTLLPGRTTSLSVRRLWARLSVETKPASLAWLDGKPVGPTPLLLDGLVPGEHRLVLRSQGYREHVRELRLTPGEAQLVKLDLDSLEGREPPPKPQGFEEE